MNTTKRSPLDVQEQETSHSKSCVSSKPSDQSVILLLTKQVHPQMFCRSTNRLINQSFQLYSHIWDKHTWVDTVQLLTAEFSVAGLQRLEIDGVFCDEAFLLVYRQMVPLDPDPPGLMDQHWQVGTRHWLWNTYSETEREDDGCRLSNEYVKVLYKNVHH